MADKRERRDGAKASFSELDKMRRERAARGDRDSGGGGSGGGGPRGAEGAGQKSYRAALERAFAEGKVDELAATLARRNETPRVMPTMPVPAPPRPVAAEAAATSGGGDGTAGDHSAPTPAPAPVRDPEREARRKALEQILIAEGRDSVTRAVDRWVAKHGPLPNDYEVLGKALAHRDDTMLLQVMDQIEACLVKQKPRRSRTLSAHLRLLEDTHDDNAIRDRAARLRSSI